jgi:hypothetical protein
MHSNLEGIQLTKLSRAGTGGGGGAALAVKGEFSVHASGSGVICVAHSVSASSKGIVSEFMFGGDADSRKP